MTVVKPHCKLRQEGDLLCLRPEVLYAFLREDTARYWWGRNLLCVQMALRVGSRRDEPLWIARDVGNGIRGYAFQRLNGLVRVLLL